MKNALYLVKLVSRDTECPDTTHVFMTKKSVEISNKSRSCSYRAEIICSREQAIANFAEQKNLSLETAENTLDKVVITM